MNINDFDDIRPLGDGEMKPAFEAMLKDRQFDKILAGMIPLPKGLRNWILKMMFTGIKTPLDFQKRYMKPLVYYVLHKCTSGYSYQFSKALDRKGNYTFMSNHRDIVLDSAILDTFLIADKFTTTVEIAIGSNLLIYPWIRTLVRMNKSFIVNRGLTPKEMLKSSIHMSQYMHFAINEKNENIWIVFIRKFANVVPRDMNRGEFVVERIFNAFDKVGFIIQNAWRFFHKFATIFFEFGDVGAKIGKFGGNTESFGVD